jgi:hypothetical protein
MNIFTDRHVILALLSRFQLTPETQETVGGFSKFPGINTCMFRLTWRSPGRLRASRNRSCDVIFRIEAHEASREPSHFPFLLHISGTNEGIR